MAATTRRMKAGAVILIAAAAILGIAGLSAAAVGTYAKETALSEHTHEVRVAANDWLSSLVDAETGVRGYVATTEVVFLEPYAAAVPRAGARADALKALVADDAAQSARVARADAEARAVLSHLGELVALVDGARRGEAVARLAAGESKRRMDAFRADVAAIRDVEARSSRSSTARARRSGRLVLVGAGVIVLFACGVLVLAWGAERAHDRRLQALADEARGRLRALSESAAALASARTRAEVAEVVITQVMRAVGADTCTLYELAATGTSLELVADRGVAPEVLDQIRSITETTGNPGALARVKAGESLWVETPADYAKIFPAIAATRAEQPRARAFWSVPLVAEGQSLGLLGVGHYEPRRFPPDERSFVETLSHHCAQAILRASRLEREDEARNWLSTTLRSIGDAVIATDAAGRVSFMNPIAETLTGWPEGEARGRPLDEVFCIFSELTRAPVESPVTKVLREGKVVGLANHTLLRSRRGVEIPIDDSGAPIRAGGKIAGVVLVFRDGTQEKNARVRREFLARSGEALVSSIDHEAILATVARFAVPTLADWCSVALLEPGAQAPRQVAVAHVDEDKVRLARELGERYPPDPNAPTGAPQVIRSGKAELYREIPRALLERGARDADHLRALRELKLESAMIVPLRARGRALGAITFIYAESGRRYSEDDLSFAEDFARRAAMAIENSLAHKETEAARAREQVLRSAAELANRAKDEFLATVSHELRTPLSAILGWVTVLRRRGAPPETDRVLSTIERNARAQAKLIDDVLDISRIISGKLALSVGTTKLGDAIAAAVETATPTASLKNITLAVEAAEELVLLADADRLQQIIWNLLANAVKFTPKGGRVTVRAGREGSDLWFHVEDTGEGIRRELLPGLFEPFRQGDASTTRRHGGLGLGLAIVRRLVVAHGGTVAAQSEGEGKGATFTVRLPARALVPVVGDAGRKASPSDAAAGDAAAEIPRLDGLRVLVVEDEQDALTLLCEVLREQGAEVKPAASAAEALAELGRLRPHVLVSDIGMPVVDGLTLIRRIRALPPDEGGETPAIALTAFARAEDVQRTLAAGYQLHLAKPTELPRLARAVLELGRAAPRAR